MPIEIPMAGAQPKETRNLLEPKPTPEGLRTSEIRYRRLFEAAQDGILILNAVTLKITDVNPFMTRLLGYSRNEFLGKELWEIGLFSDKEASQDAFRELQAKGYLRFEDLPLQTRHGESREVEFVSNVYEEDGAQVIQCNIRDISERKRAEEECTRLLERAITAQAEADKANSIKDEFLALLSHELRTPLSAILGWSQLLAGGKLDTLTSKHALEIIVRNAHAQNQLIDDLLDISRIISGKLRLDVEPVELAPMIESVVESVRPAADARNIRLLTELDSRLNPIPGDPVRLQQVVSNLLTNAIKFTANGGHVQVGLAYTALSVEITVNDTGQGIDPELLPYVFDRFRQSDSSTTRSHGGLGVGLSIVRQLVELHGGTVAAESPGEGAGATFKVLLPLSGGYQERKVKTVPLMIASTTPPNPQPALNNLRVLIVDDELDSRELIAAVLTERGAEVVSVGSAAEALEEMDRQLFDVLVSDIGMPVMDGYALIEQVRQLPAEGGGRIPAVALTAYAGIEDRRRAISAGYQMHVSKPVEPAELTTVVANLAQGCAEAEAV